MFKNICVLFKDSILQLCLDDSKIRLSLPKPFRILLKLWKVVGNIRLPFPAYLLYLFARLVVQRDF